MARAAKHEQEMRIHVPPQNIEAEQSLLGGILIDPESMNKIVDIVSSEDFYRDAHQKVFGVMLDLYERNEAIDILTVSSLAKDKGLMETIGGITYLNTLVDIMPSAANIAYYARMVREKALMRRLINAATVIIEKGHDPDTNVDGYIDEAENLVFQVAENKFRPSFFSMKDIVWDNVKTIDMLSQKKQHVIGVATGFTDLDKLTSGFQPADLIVVAGRPSMGKTALCMNVAQHVSLSRDGQGPVTVGIFSLEMSKEQLVTRMLSSESNIDHSRLRTGALSPADWRSLTQAASRLVESSIFIDDSPGLTVLDVRARARRLKKEHDLGLIVVDYLQLMRGRTNIERREQEISEISRSLKALAKELHLPVIAISQLNRMVEQREDKRPRLSDLRESGAIEQDADVIIFIYRDEVYQKKPDNEGKAEIIIGKQRNGPTDTVILTFLKESATFRNYFRED
jgi:replicative DNA helicase